jgi:hypothetical protein
MLSRWGELPSPPGCRGRGTMHNNGSKREGLPSHVWPTPVSLASVNWGGNSMRYAMYRACGVEAEEESVGQSSGNRRRPSVDGLHPCRKETPFYAESQVTNKHARVPLDRCHSA